jgi:hypothetical protein
MKPKKKPKEEPEKMDINERFNLYGPSLSTPAGIDRAMFGRHRDGRRYLGGGCWQVVDHETSRTNERREGRP